METLTSIPFLAMCLGFTVWAYASRPRTASPFWDEVGRLTFAAGLLITLWKVAGKSLF